MRRIARRLLGGGLCGLLACSAITGVENLREVPGSAGLDGSTLGDTGSQGIGDAREGGATTDGADAARDTTPNVDAPTSVDVPVAPDAPSPPDAPAVAFCASLDAAATFCCDFDEPDAMGAWDPPSIPPGSMLFLDTQYASSPPQSLHAVTYEGGLPYLNKGVTVGSQLGVDFDILFVSYDAGAVAPVTVTPGSGANLLYYFNGIATYFQLYAPVTGSDFGYNAPVGFGSWHHVSILIAVGPSGSTITASFDGVLAWNAHPMATPWAPNTTVDVSVGVAFLYQTPQGEALIDNVVIGAQ
jgi:hypothetical protein